MLKLRYLFENYDLAKEALQNWAHDEDTLDELLVQFRISSNAIYPYRQDGKVCFLRLAPVAEKREQNIVGEMEFLDYLHAGGYKALMPIPARTGELYLTLSTKWGDYYASAFSRVPGKALDRMQLTDEIVFSYGRALGRLHALSEGFQPKSRKWTHEEALDWIDGVLKEYRAPDGVIAASARIRSELASLPKTTENYGLVHYDFELDNVFYDAESNSCAAIDFDDGMYHFYAIDVEQALDSLIEEAEGGAPEHAEQIFLKGYKAAHCYTEEMDATRPLMRAFCTLYAYARLIRSVFETFPDEPDWLIELRKKLDRAIRNKESALISFGKGA